MSGIAHVLLQRQNGRVDAVRDLWVLRARELEHKLSDHEAEVDEMQQRIEDLKSELTAARREEKELKIKERTTTSQLATVSYMCSGFGSLRRLCGRSFLARGGDVKTSAPAGNFSCVVSGYAEAVSGTMWYVHLTCLRL